VRAFNDVFMVTALVTRLAIVPAFVIGDKVAGSSHTE
jgi:hypothetical protein